MDGEQHDPHENRNGDGSMGFTLLSKVILVYGPYAFSLVSLMLIWFSIVNPVLDRQMIDYQKHEMMVDKLREVATTQLESARSIERASIILDAIVKKLETKLDR